MLHVAESDFESHSAVSYLKINFTLNQFSKKIKKWSSIYHNLLCIKSFPRCQKPYCGLYLFYVRHLIFCSVKGFFSTLNLIRMADRLWQCLNYFKKIRNSEQCRIVLKLGSYKRLYCLANIFSSLSLLLRKLSHQYIIQLFFCSCKNFIWFNIIHFNLSFIQTNNIKPSFNL